jgi:pentatricopeptide repeat protein
MDVSKVNRMIKECTEDGFFEDAIRVYLDFIECGFPVEEFRFFPCLIKAFGGLYDVNKGKQIHGHLLKFGFLQDIFVKNSLLGMYWKCGAGGNAVDMFERMEERDSVSWNTMISGFCQSGDYVKSLVMFRRMVKECGGSYHNRVACLAALSSCASIKCLTHGLEIHGFLVKKGVDSDEFLVSALIEMYMKCGDIKNAENVFERIRDNELVGRNMAVWNVMILGYVSNECLSLALELFVEMLELGISPDSSTVVVVLVL